MNYRILYFASLAEQAACSAEQFESTATTLPALYAQVAQRHGFSMSPSQLRVAVGGAFVDWQHPLAAGDEVAFLPPVSGG